MHYLHKVRKDLLTLSPVAVPSNQALSPGADTGLWLSPGVTRSGSPPRQPAQLGPPVAEQPARALIQPGAFAISIAQPGSADPPARHVAKPDTHRPASRARAEVPLRPVSDNPPTVL